MNETATSAPEEQKTEPEGQEATDAAKFSAGKYIKRTRDVLQSKTQEASKLQADTRAALWGVFKELRSDLQGEVSSFATSVKERAENLRQHLPFKPADKAAEAPEAAAEEKTEEQPPAA